MGVNTIQAEALDSTTVVSEVESEQLVTKDSLVLGTITSLNDEREKDVSELTSISIAHSGLLSVSYSLSIQESRLLSESSSLSISESDSLSELRSLSISESHSLSELPSLSLSESEVYKGSLSKSSLSSLAKEDSLSDNKSDFSESLVQEKMRNTASNAGVTSETIDTIEVTESLSVVTSNLIEQNHSNIDLMGLVNNVSVTSKLSSELEVKRQHFSVQFL